MPPMASRLLSPRSGASATAAAAAARARDAPTDGAIAAEEEKEKEEEEEDSPLLRHLEKIVSNARKRGTGNLCRELAKLVEEQSADEEERPRSRS